MNRPQALLIVLALWAAIYLPGLGSTEIKGEEGRRILPGMTMLETHQWLVPYVGGRPFFRKPPLINWLIAGSFRITGLRNEWTARLPSVLFMLALAVAIVAVSGEATWMTPQTALVAAVVALTQVSSVEKGRLAEIDAVYSALAGIAIVLWLAWWMQRRSPWLVWLVPAVFLGLAALAKGPLHLLYFYGIVAAVLWRTGEWRLLRQRAHAVPFLLSLVVIYGLWEAWYHPYMQTEAARETAAVWRGQFFGRLMGKFDFVGWLTAIPRGLLDHLPWVLFAPLLWRAELPQLGERPAAMFRGVRQALVLFFVVLLLLPGMLPRYVMPLFAPFSLLLAWALADERLTPPARALRVWWRANHVFAALLILGACAAPIAIAIAENHYALAYHGYSSESFFAYLFFPLLAAGCAMVLALVALLRRHLLARPSLLALTTGALVGGVMLLYAGAGMPIINRHATLPAMGSAINATVPHGEYLYLFDPDFLPEIFYLTVPCRYAPELTDLPAGARWVLAKEDSYRKVLRARPEFSPVSKLPEGEPTRLVLLKSNL